MKKYVMYHPIADDIFISPISYFYVIEDGILYEIDAICEL